MSNFYKINIFGRGENLLDKLPDNCPFCHKSITPITISAYLVGENLQAFLACPDHKCFKTFIGYYNFHPSISSFNGHISQGTLVDRKFNDEIQIRFSSFSKIYNEAYCAEQQNLFEICGVGYRKALEFLIKDYAVLKFPENVESIQKLPLAKVISEFVTDGNIKSVSKRAVWLGNDETHYIRKWEGKDLNDLKKLIDLTVHWVEMEILTGTFEDEMPE